VECFNLFYFVYADFKEAHSVVYDGVIQLKPTTSESRVGQFFNKALKKIFGSSSSKPKEQTLAYGFRAMLKAKRADTSIWFQGHAACLD